MPALELDFDRIAAMVDEGYLTKRKHPELDLWILNYTCKVQYTGAWDNETINCRGLVVDANNQIVARSFPKFFNYEELFVHPELNQQLLSHLENGDRFTVTEKMDGSLILVFGYQGHRVVASRGSFESTQAWKAREILETKYPKFNPEVSVGTAFIFEVIYPENRIVVNYGDKEDLCYLSAMGLDGQEYGAFALAWCPTFDPPFPMPEMFEFSSLEEVKDCWQSTNFEGFVMHFPDSGLRVKFKWDEYRRLHRLLTGITPRHIWEELAAGRDLAPLMDMVPDEFYAWVNGIASSLNQQFRSIWCQCINDLLEAKRRGFAERKQYAEFFKTCARPHVLFLMLDGRDATELIWKYLKPEGTAFRCCD